MDLSTTSLQKIRQNLTKDALNNAVFSCGKIHIYVLFPQNDPQFMGKGKYTKTSLVSFKSFLPWLAVGKKTTKKDQIDGNKKKVPKNIPSEL